LYYIFANIYNSIQTGIMSMFSFASDAVVLGVVLMLLLIVMFSDQISYFLHATKTTVLSMLGARRRLSCGCSGICRGECLSNSPTQEDMSNEVRSAGDASQVVGSGSDALTALGYADGGDMPWGEMIKVTDLDGSVHINHNSFVADVRRFSSGANFTSVADDNTNDAFTNFVGLQRPQHVAILPDARQQPDVDQDVLARNTQLRWR